ncbi:MAG: 4Fe-4S dicluster domain-containing protein [Sphaerochaetaceae bacterium]
MNRVVVENELCKGCAVCVAECPQQALIMGTELNSLGYNYVLFLPAKGCTACTYCFLNCPEPGALTVLKEVN